ncbi:MAG: hypothetical protein E5W26_21650, partial [Mesorhizobium sp.]
MKKSIFVALTIALAGCQTGQADSNPASIASAAGSNKARNEPSTGHRRAEPHWSAPSPPSSRPRRRRFP